MTAELATAIVQIYQAESYLDDKMSLACMHGNRFNVFYVNHGIVEKDSIGVRNIFVRVKKNSPKRFSPTNTVSV